MSIVEYLEPMFARLQIAQRVGARGVGRGFPARSRPRHGDPHAGDGVTRVRVADDALQAVKFLKPKVVIPCHYNTWPPIQQDAEAWAQRVGADDVLDGRDTGAITRRAALVAKPDNRPLVASPRSRKATVVALEEILEDTCFEQEDEEKVLNYMCRKPLTVFYRFPHNRDSFSLEIPGATVHQFIKRLNISKQIDRRLISTIKKNVGETHRRRFTVRIRNSRFQASDSALDFLYAFFEKWNMQASDVMPHFDFILSFLEELQEDTDIYDALMKKKRFYFKHLKRTEQFEERLLKSNMETLMLSGKITSVMDKNEARDKIKIIDQIGLTIFGKTESIDLHADNVESMNLSSNRDLQNVIRRLS